MDDLDDLFRESAPAAQTHPLGIRDRIDELRKIGCCDKLSWAPSGVLAYVALDKTNVNLLSFRYRDREGKWSPQHATIDPLPRQLRTIFDGSQIMHISFNPHGTGNELVVIDVFGRIFCAGPQHSSFNRLGLFYAFSSSKNDLNRVVGLHWLTPNREFANGTAFYREVYKQGSSWNFHKPEALPALGPSNPHSGGHPLSLGRPAFLALTTSGKLTLYYSKSDAKTGSWDSTSHELFHFENSSMALTHAAMCCVFNNGDSKFSAGEVWVATIDTNRQIHIRSVQVRWQAQQPPPPQPGQQAQQQQQTATAIITHSSLATLPFVNPVLSNGVPENSIPTEVSFMRLILDRTAAPEDRGSLRLLVGCHAMRDSEQGMAGGYQTGTMISQYTLRVKKPEADACWASLNSKLTPRNTVRDQLYAQRLDDEKFSGLILDLREHRCGSMYALAYSDGKIEYRNKDLKIPPLAMSNDSVAGLHAIGFSFTGGEPCLYNVASPHACVRATMGHSHSLKLQPIQASVPLMEVTDPDFKTKASAVFALELLNASHTADIIDIIVAMRALTQQLPNDQAESFKTSVLHYYGGPGTQLIGKLHEQSERLVAVPHIQRLLSVQEALGHVGGSKGRSPASLTAWILLQVRHCMIQIHTGMAQSKDSNNQSKTRMAQPEVAKLIGHCIRWFTTLVDWLVEQILLANRAIDFPKTFKPDEINFQPHELPARVPSNTHVACALLGLPFSRNLLKSVTARVITLQQRVYGAVDPQDLSPDWTPWQATEDETVISMYEFSKFLNSCETAWTKIHKEHQTPGGGIPSISEPMLREQEARLLGTARFDNQWNLQFLAQLVTTGAWNLRGCCDEARLAFRDYTLLGFGSDEAAREFAERCVWDVARKNVVAERVRGGEGRVVLSPAVVVKVCMRCGAVTEDVGARWSPVLVQWAAMLDSRCVCGGHWVSEQKETGQEKGEVN